MKTLKKIVIDEDLKASGINITSAWVIGKTASLVSSIFGFNLNQYNSIDHLMIGVGIGTFAYRKAGGGTKGILAGLTAATMFNATWEGFEKGFNPYHTQWSMVDTLSDIAVVYSASMLGCAAEKWKDYITKKDEKWVL